MSRCRSRLLPPVALLAVMLGACGSGEPPPPLPEPPAPAPAGDIEDAIFPHVSARMPAEGLEPDGRVAPWALGVQIGATLHALAEACGEQDLPSLQVMQREQRDAVMAQDVDAGRYDAVWTWAYRHARQKITLQPSTELARGCAGLHEMQQDAERMQELMRPMALP